MNDRGDQGTSPGAAGPRTVPAAWNKLIGGAVYRYQVIEGGKLQDEEGWLSSYNHDLGTGAIDATFSVESKRILRRFAFKDALAWKDVVITEVRG